MSQATITVYNDNNGTARHTWCVVTDSSGNSTTMSFGPEEPSSAILGYPCAPSFSTEKCTMDRLSGDNTSATYHISDQQCSSIQNNYSSIQNNPPLYDVNDYNCTMFTSDLLEGIGIYDFEDCDYPWDAEDTIASRLIGAIIDVERCAGCNGGNCDKCVSVCPTSAISKNSDGEYEVSQSDCIGCGECVNVCTSQAIISRGIPSMAPIMLDLDGDGVELIAFNNSAVQYGIDGDGCLKRVDWASSDDALLGIDANGDGLISDREEIAFTDYIDGAQPDLEDLLFFDTNQDNQLSTNDEQSNNFIVWQEVNQNRVCEDGEVVSLLEAGIFSISIESDNEFFTLEHNAVYGLSSTTEDETICEVGHVSFNYIDLLEGTGSADDTAPSGDTTARSEEEQPALPSQKAADQADKVRALIDSMTSYAPEDPGSVNSSINNDHEPCVVAADNEPDRKETASLYL